MSKIKKEKDKFEHIMWYILILLAVVSLIVAYIKDYFNPQSTFYSCCGILAAITACILLFDVSFYGKKFNRSMTDKEKYALIAVFVYAIIVILIAVLGMGSGLNLGDWKGLLTLEPLFVLFWYTKFLFGDIQWGPDDRKPTMTEDDASLKSVKSNKKIK